MDTITTTQFGWLQTYARDGVFAPKTISSLIYTADGYSYEAIVESRFTSVEAEITKKPGRVVYAGYNETTKQLEGTSEIFNDFRPSNYNNFEDDIESVIGQILSIGTKPVGNIITNTAFFAHAEGTGTTASAAGAHAEGKWTTAAHQATHAEGYGSKAFSAGAHAEGVGTTAGQNPSDEQATVNNKEYLGAHSEGVKTKAQGRAAHAEGENTFATSYAHAEGDSTQATGARSHAEGYGTIAAGEAQHVQGRYNISDAHKAHIIGGGTSASNKKNIHTVDWSGNAWYAGDMQFDKRLIGTLNPGSSANVGLFGYGTPDDLPAVNPQEGQIFFLIIPEEE